MPETKINYGARTYEEIKADLVQAIDTFTPEWTDKSDTDMGIVLLKLFSYVGDLCMFHLGRLANEINFSTALDIESMLTYAKLLNFPVRSPQAAKTDIVFELSAVSAEDYTVPARTRVRSRSNPEVIFETVADLVIPAGNLGTEQYQDGAYMYATEARHWTWVSEEVLGSVQPREDGSTDFLSFLLQFGTVIKDTVAVKVLENGSPVPWARKDIFLTETGDDKAYVVEIDSDGTGLIRFGNGAIGAMPPLGTDNVIAAYAYGGGVSGNDLAVGDISQLEVVIPYIRSASNVSVSYGGSDFQSVAELKKVMPYAWAAMERAVTEADFIAMSKTYSTVSKVAIGYESDTNTVLVYPLLASGVVLPAIDKTALKNLLLQKSIVGSRISIKDPYFVGVDIDIAFAPIVGYSQSAVQQALAAAVQGMFAFSERDLGESEYLSEVYRVAEEVEGLNFANITKMSRVPLAVPEDGNIGTADFTEIVTNEATLPKTWVMKMISGTGFEVRYGAEVSFGDLGTPFDNGEIAFTATAGATAPLVNDKWTIRTSAYIGNQLADQIEILKIRNLNVTVA